MKLEVADLVPGTTFACNGETFTVMASTLHDPPVRRSSRHSLRDKTLGEVLLLSMLGAEIWYIERTPLRAEFQRMHDDGPWLCSETRPMLRDHTIWFHLSWCDLIVRVEGAGGDRRPLRELEK